MSAKISVIIPVYNASGLLPDCLQSIALQTWTDLEMLLVDDGSTDDSACICRSFCEKDSRFRLLQKENGGVSSARNLGLEEASGDYIAFVDADDWLCPEMLEHQAECLEKDGSDMAMCGFQEAGEAERRQFRRDCEAGEGTQLLLKPGKKPPEHISMPVEAYVADYLLAGNTRCWSILFRKELLQKARFQEGLTIGEDLLFLIDLLPALKRVSLIKTREYCYYINDDGAMFSGFKPAYMDQITCWQQAREKIKLLYPDYTAKADISLFQAALLTAGKLALLPAEERRAMADYTEVCRKAAREAVRDRMVRRGLPAGYQLKGLLFLLAPPLYLGLYHHWKGRR
ncbi:glycosyltransferase family 2 protein [Eisenbergiella sp.]